MLMFVVGLGRGRSSTIFVEAAASAIGVQTSDRSEPLTSAICLNPNSFRVGKVSATSASPENQELYTASQPYAAAKFCCAELASSVWLAVGSTVAASITFGFVTSTNLLEQAAVPQISTETAMRSEERRVGKEGRSLWS